MSQDLTTIHEKSGMAVFTPAAAKFVRETFCPEATDIELAYFAQLVNDLGLDPRRGEVHLVSRWDSKLKRMKATPQVSLQGMLSLAERSGEYRGHTQYEWCGPDGKWVEVWLAPDPPAAARVGVRRAGYPEPVFGIARWSSYAVMKKDGTPTSMWAQFPDRMLAKCALNQALREAFPRNLNGVYGNEEMQQAADTPPALRGDDMPREIEAAAS
jgi:phage recombination protein Bet